MQKQTPSSLLLVAAIAGGAGFVAFVALMLVGGFTVSPAAFLAILVAGAVAVFLFTALHKGPKDDLPELKASSDGKLGDRTRRAGTAGVEPGTAGVKPGSFGSGTANNTMAARTSGTAQTPSDTSTASAGATAATMGAPKGSADGASPTGPAHDDVDPSKVAGRADLMEDRADASSGADRPQNKDKSSTGGSTSDATSSAGAGATEADTAGASVKAVGADATKPTSGIDGESGGTGTTQADAASSDQKWKSTQVQGTEELASRKGEWKYDAGKGGAATASTATAASAGSAAEPEEPVGIEPTRLDAPREGGADDLKRIKGVGPKMETMLHDMGFYHFDQIANWSDEELAWVDTRLEGFKGRASRDEWVSQAKALASGEETDFSKRVDGGDVY